MALNFLSIGRHSLSVADSDFGFAFNEKNFSDRVLRIEITTGVVENKSEDQNCSRLIGWTDKGNRKRRRTEDTEKENTLDADIHREEHNLNYIPEQNTDDIDGFDDLKEEGAVEMHEESPLVRNTNLFGDEAANSVKPNSIASHILQVKNIHISSLILASKSIHFYELFSKETRESENRQVTLRIHASEEAALMDLLRFMYSNTLSTTSTSGLLDVLIAADKYKVSSCIRYCTMFLQSLPMTCESALVYLELLSSVRMVDVVQPLLDAAKKHLAIHFKDFMRHPQELLKLPLVGIEAVLSSDDLQLPTEDTVYDFLLKWASIHYPKPDERREIMSTRLSRLIRFHYMSCRKLRSALTCFDLDYTVSHKVVLEALFYKSEPAYKQRQISGTSGYPVERNYKYRMAKMVEFESPRPQCIVYIDIKREECHRLLTSGRAYVQVFSLDGRGFFLSANCNLDQQTRFHSFGLFLGMQNKGVSPSVSVDYEFSAMWKPSQEYRRRYKGNYTLVGGNVVGYRNLFNSMPWEDFLAENSIYFIDGMLRLRADLTIIK